VAATSLKKSGRSPSQLPPLGSAHDAASAWNRLRLVFRRHPGIAYALAFVVLVLGLCVVRFPIIASPPYYDFATGLFLEANFLAETNFDYSALIREQSRWLEGGAAVYITSVMPTFVAVLMKTLPSPQAVFVAYHVFNFACAAAVALLLFTLLKAYIPPSGALLTAAMLLTAPVFSTQIDMLGMDLPMAACALSAALFIQRRQYLLAALPGLAASLVKSPGRAVASAVVVYLVFLLLLAIREPARAKRALWLGLGANLLVVAFQDWQANFLADLPQSSVENWSYSKQLFGGENMLRYTIKWFPDQVTIFAASAGGCAVVGGLWIYRQLRGNVPQLAMLHAAAVRFGPLVVGWIVVTAVLVALSVVYCLPRYFMLPLPFVYLAFGCLLFWRPRWRRVSAGLALGLILLNIANADGRFYPAIPEAQRTGAILERSREYLADHDSNIAAVRLLERDYGDHAIIAATPFVHFLSLPSLGYVKRPLKGYAMGRFHAGGFVSGMRLPEDKPRDVIFVYVKNPFSGATIQQPRQTDDVLYDDRQPSPLIVYRRHWPDEMSDAALRREYEMMVLPSEGYQAMAQQQLAAGNYTAAVELLRHALRLSPYDPKTHYGLGYALVKLGNYPPGIAHLQAAIQYDPKYDPAYALLGATLAEQKQFEEAIAMLHKAVELNPRDATSWITLGKVYFVQGNVAEMERHYGEALRLRPDDIELRREFEQLRGRLHSNESTHR
jgi:hypothetical protein